MASTAEVDLVISTAGTLPELERELQQIISTAEANADDIDIEASINRQETIGNLISDLNSVISNASSFVPQVEIDAALNRVDALQDISDALDDAIIAAQVSAAAIQVEAELDANVASLDAELAALVAELEAGAPDVDIEVNIDRDGQGASSGRGLTRVLGSLGRVLPSVSGQMLAFGSAGAAALPVAAALSATVESILPASAVAVTGLTALALAGGALTLAFKGVGDAISTAFDPAAKPEDLAKAMEKLAPNARAFVTELRGMRSQFKEIQQGVQEEFFNGFSDALISLRTNVLPQFGTALLSTSAILNQMALGAAAAAIELGANGTLQTALLGATEGLANLKTIPGQVVTALGQIGAAASPAFERITQGAANAATSISTKLAAAFKSGALESAINGAIDAIAQLGRIAGNVFEGLGNIFENLNAGGEGLFSVLEKVTAGFAKVTASQGFQQALTALSQTLNVVVETVLPLLSQALQALGPVFQALAAPVQILVRALGDGLSKIIVALEPVLVSVGQAFGQLVIAVTPLINLAATLIAAVLPGLIPLFDALGSTLNTLVPFIETLATALATALVPLFTKIATEVLPQLLPPLVELSTKLIPVLTEVILELAPVLTTIATVFGEVLVAVTPLIVELINMTLAIGEQLTPILAPLLAGIIALTQFGFNFLASIITGVVIPVINIIVDLLRGDFTAAWEGAKELVRNVAAKVGELIAAMNERIKSILTDLARAAGEKTRELVNSFTTEFNKLVSKAGEIASQVPGAVLAGLGHLGSLLVSAGADLVRGLINGIRSQLGALRDMASQVAETVSGSVKDLLGISSPSKVMREVGQDTMAGFELGIADQIPDLRSQLQGVAALAPSFALPNGQKLQLPQLGQQGPTVQVFIGNEQLNGHFDARIARSDQARDLLLTRGVRR